MFRDTADLKTQMESMEDENTFLVASDQHGIGYRYSDSFIMRSISVLWKSSHNLCMNFASQGSISYVWADL